MNNLKDIAPLPWKMENKTCGIEDNNGNIILANIDMYCNNPNKVSEYIVTACNEYELLKETCKKMLDQDTAHFDTINQLNYYNSLVKDTNNVLISEGEKLREKLKIAITFIKTLDSKDGNSILELLRDGVNLE